MQAKGYRGYTILYDNTTWAVKELAKQFPSENAAHAAIDERYALIPIELRDRVPGCFGSVDKIFGKHPLERRAASELLQTVLEKKIPLEQIKEAARVHLASCQGPHIEEQIARMDHLPNWIE